MQEYCFEEEKAEERETERKNGGISKHKRMCAEWESGLECVCVRMFTRCDLRSATYFIHNFRSFAFCFVVFAVQFEMLLRRGGET